MESPRITIRKYSGALNIRETFPSNGAIVRSAIPLTAPPNMEATVDIPIASSPRPFFVSAYPSPAVAADDGVPGVWIRIAVREPP